VSQFAPLPTPALPETTQKTIGEFVLAARTAFETNLSAVVLYGSAAEGKQRPTSDVNVILVLSSFERSQVDAIRQTLRLAQSSVQLNVMFLLRDEILAAAQSFAPKFADVLRRRAILYGEDPFSGISVPRDAEIRQLRQQLLNLTLRMRSTYAARSLREEQLAIFLANSVGAIRSLAQILLDLQGRPASSQQEAFLRIGDELGLPEWNGALQAIDQIQATQIGEAGVAAKVYLQVLDCVQRMRAKAETIGGEARHESI